MAQIASVFKQAVSQLQAKNYIQAEQLCSQILQQIPNQPDALHLIALAAKQQDNLLKARQFFERSLDANSNQPAVLSNFANLLVLLKEYELAELNYQKSLQLQPENIDVKYNFASLLEQLKRYQLAIKNLDELIASNVKNVNIFNLKGNCLRKLGRYDEALAVYDFALELEPGNFFAMHNKGVTFREMQNPQAALSCYQAIAIEGANLPEYQFNVGCANFDIGDVDAAENSLKQAIILKPDYIDAHDSLNKLYWEHGKEKEFLESFRSALKNNMGSSSLWYSYAANLIMANKNNDAKIILEKAIKTVGKNPNLTHALGVLLSKENQYDKAYDLISYSASKHPEAARYQIDLANILIKQEEYKNASMHLDLALKSNPLNQEVWAYKGICWRLLDDERHVWLNDYDNLISAELLETPNGYDDLEHFLSVLKGELTRLHTSTHQPLDQSVRGGTQTIGNLLMQSNKVIQDYRSVLLRRIERYIQRLPEDPSHPFLNRNTGKFNIAGSWSVLLRTGGFHTNHVHPEGWLSGPTYITIPPELSSSDPDKSGWVKFGETSLNLGERETIGMAVCPTPGLCVLFPSYVWHGTFPFASNKTRMTTPCDISPL